MCPPLYVGVRSVSGVSFSRAGKLMKKQENRSIYSKIIREKATTFSGSQNDFHSF